MDILNKVPIKSKFIARKEKDGYVIFNLETSGFHWLSKEAYEVLEKCDGSRSIKELALFFSKKKNEPVKRIEKQFCDFFKKLEERKLIKWK
jgi:hypothetical protein